MSATIEINALSSSGSSGKKYEVNSNIVTGDLSASGDCSTGTEGKYRSLLPDQPQLLCSAGGDEPSKCHQQQPIDDDLDVDSSLHSKSEDALGFQVSTTVVADEQNGVDEKGSDLDLRVSDENELRDGDRTEGDCPSNESLQTGNNQSEDADVDVNLNLAPNQELISSESELERLEPSSNKVSVVPPKISDKQGDDASFSKEEIPVETGKSRSKKRGGIFHGVQFHLPKLGLKRGQQSSKDRDWSTSSDADSSPEKRSGKKKKRDKHEKKRRAIEDGRDVDGDVTMVNDDDGNVVLVEEGCQTMDVQQNISDLTEGDENPEDNTHSQDPELDTDRDTTDASVVQTPPESMSLEEAAEESPEHMEQNEEDGQISGLQNEEDGQISGLQNDEDGQISGLQNDEDGQISGLQNEEDGQISGLQNEEDGQISGLQNEEDGQISGLQNEEDGQISGLQNEEDGQISGLQNEEDGQISGLQNEEDGQISGLQNEEDGQISGLQNEEDGQISGLQNEEDGQISGLQNEEERQISGLQYEESKIMEPKTDPDAVAMVTEDADDELMEECRTTTDGANARNQPTPGPNDNEASSLPNSSFASAQDFYTIPECSLISSTNPDSETTPDQQDNSWASKPSGSSTLAEVESLVTDPSTKSYPELAHASQPEDCSPLASKTDVQFEKPDVIPAEDEEPSMLSSSNQSSFDTDSPSRADTPVHSPKKRSKRLLPHLNVSLPSFGKRHHRSSKAPDHSSDSDRPTSPSKRFPWKKKSPKKAPSPGIAGSSSPEEVKKDADPMPEGGKDEGEASVQTSLAVTEAPKMKHSKMDLSVGINADVAVAGDLPKAEISREEKNSSDDEFKEAEISCRDLEESDSKAQDDDVPAEKDDQDIQEAIASQDEEDSSDMKAIAPEVTSPSQEEEQQEKQEEKEKEKEEEKEEEEKEEEGEEEEEEEEMREEEYSLPEDDIDVQDGEVKHGRIKMSASLEVHASPTHHVSSPADFVFSGNSTEAEDETEVQAEINTPNSSLADHSVELNAEKILEGCHQLLADDSLGDVQLTPEMLREITKTIDDFEECEGERRGEEDSKMEEEMDAEEEEQVLDLEGRSDLKMHTEKVDTEDSSSAEAVGFVAVDVGCQMNWEGEGEEEMGISGIDGNVQIASDLRIKVSATEEEDTKSLSSPSSSPSDSPQGNEPKEVPVDVEPSTELNVQTAVFALEPDNIAAHVEVPSVDQPPDVSPNTPRIDEVGGVEAASPASKPVEIETNTKLPETSTSVSVSAVGSSIGPPHLQESVKEPEIEILPVMNEEGLPEGKSAGQDGKRKSKSKGIFSGFNFRLPRFRGRRSGKLDVTSSKAHPDMNEGKISFSSDEKRRADEAVEPTASGISKSSSEYDVSRRRSDENDDEFALDNRAPSVPDISHRDKALKATKKKSFTLPNMHLRLPRFGGKKSPKSPTKNDIKEVDPPTPKPELTVAGQPEVDVDVPTLSFEAEHSMTTDFELNLPSCDEDKHSQEEQLPTVDAAERESPDIKATCDISGLPDVAEDIGIDVQEAKPQIDGVFVAVPAFIEEYSGSEDSLQAEMIANDSQTSKPEAFEVDLQTGKPEAFEVDLQTGKPEAFEVDLQTGKPKAFEVDLQTSKPEALEVDLQTSKPEAFEVDLQTGKPEAFEVDLQTSKPEAFEVDLQTSKPEAFEIDLQTGKPESAFEVDLQTSKPEVFEVDSQTSKPEAFEVDLQTGKPKAFEVDLQTSKPEALEVDLQTSKPEAFEVDLQTSKPEALEDELQADKPEFKINLPSLNNIQSDIIEEQEADVDTNLSAHIDVPADVINQSIPDYSKVELSDKLEVSLPSDHQTIGVANHKSCDEIGVPDANIIVDAPNDVEVDAKGSWEVRMPMVAEVHPSLPDINADAAGELDSTDSCSNNTFIDKLDLMTSGESDQNKELDANVSVGLALSSESGDTSLENQVDPVCSPEEEQKVTVASENDSKLTSPEPKSSPTKHRFKLPSMNFSLPKFSGLRSPTKKLKKDQTSNTEICVTGDLGLSEDESGGSVPRKVEEDIEAVTETNLESVCETSYMKPDVDLTADLQIRFGSLGGTDKSLDVEDNVRAQLDFEVDGKQGNVSCSQDADSGSQLNGEGNDDQTSGFNELGLRLAEFSFGVEPSNSHPECENDKEEPSHEPSEDGRGSPVDLNWDDEMCSRVQKPAPKFTLSDIKGGLSLGVAISEDGSIDAEAPERMEIMQSDEQVGELKEDDEVDHSLPEKPDLTVGPNEQFVPEDTASPQLTDTSLSVDTTISERKPSISSHSSAKSASSRNSQTDTSESKKKHGIMASLGLPHLHLKLPSPRSKSPRRQAVKTKQPEEKDKGAAVTVADADAATKKLDGKKSKKTRWRAGKSSKGKRKKDSSSGEGIPLNDSNTDLSLNMTANAEMNGNQGSCLDLDPQPSTSCGPATSTPIKSPLSHNNSAQIPQSPCSLNIEQAIAVHSSPATPISSQPPSHKPFAVVIAIDFGTTFSGYAYSFARDPDDVQIMRKWEGGDPGVTNMKTPTTLLLSPTGEFHSFGFTARDFYHDMDHNEAQRWQYFDKFKLVLHNVPDLNLATELTAANGMKFPAIKVFEHSLRFFREHAMEELCDQSNDGKFDPDDIRWVLTVPAIWKQPAKQFMREAAYRAGIASSSFPEQLLIALEPEAASVCIRKLRMRELVPERLSQRRKWKTDKPEKSDSQVAEKITHGTRYMVVDCGGGTVDITVHEVEEEEGTLKELHKATGGMHGSVSVDIEFEKLLMDIFTKDFIQEFKIKRPAGWVDLMIAFESRKRTVNPYKNNPLNVSLPFSFIDYYKKYTQETASVEDAIWHFKSKDVTWSAQGMLRFSPEGMQALFKPAVANIIALVEGLLNQPQLEGVSYLFLAGGFAQSPLLQNQMRKKFTSRLRVIIPRDVGLTILRGAVMFGLDPTAVRVRRSRLTYGVGVLNKFDAKKHPEVKHVVKDKLDWCRDVFDTFVQADQSIAVGDKVTRSYTPAKPTQEKIIINIYCTEREQVDFITDEGVYKCGTMHIDVSDAENVSLKKRRELQLTMQYGDTEIKVSALDVPTGRCVKSSIDFLSK